MAGQDPKRISPRTASSGNQLMGAVGSADARIEADAISSFVDLRVDGLLLAGYTTHRSWCRNRPS